MELQSVGSVLDVGSGLGQMTRAIARNLEAGARVVGVENSDEQFEEAIRQATEAGESSLVEFRKGDATNLPLTESERGSYDLSHARFVLEHVRDPLHVVTELVAATRIGGRIFLMDDDHDLLRFSPECPELEFAWKTYWQSYRSLGHDPLVGRRLPELLIQAGAQPTRISTIFYGAVTGQELFDPVVDNIIGVIASWVDELEDSGRFSKEQWQETQFKTEQWRKQPAAAVWYSLPYAEGIRVD
jgi:SAM-dependent methyltransferase